MNKNGYTDIPKILTDDQCEKLIQAYNNETNHFCLFRKRQFIGHERKNTDKLASPFATNYKSKNSENQFNF